MKMSKEQIKESLDQIPISSILTKDRAKTLTPKQKAFVKEHVINGLSKGQAYKKAYNTKMSTRNVSVDGHKLAKKPNVSLEIERVKLAVEAMEYRSPSHLRALVVDSLTKVLLDEDAKHSDKIQASKVIGEITGVDLFKPTIEQTKNVSSKVAKDQLMNEIKKMLTNSSNDVVDIEAKALLDELTGEPHPGGSPQIEQESTVPESHSIPLKSPADISDSIVDTISDLIGDK
jgi:hypothetical protein